MTPKLLLGSLPLDITIQFPLALSNLLVLSSYIVLRPLSVVIGRMTLVVSFLLNFRLLTLSFVQSLHLLLIEIPRGIFSLRIFLQPQIPLSQLQWVVTFNTVFNPTLDRCSPCLFSSSRESSDTLSRLFADADVIDIWRHLHPDQSSFSWTRSDGVYASRIDIIGCPSTWVPFITSSSILVCQYSHHDASALLFLAFPRVP